MTRSQLRSLAVTASATAMLLCAGARAFAQDNPPPTSVPPPMQAMSAPKGSEDMTGSIGFGVGLANSANSLVSVATGNQVAIKYWLSDVLAVSPSLVFNVNKPNGQTTAWEFNPQAVVLFVPFRSTSTRFSLGGGLGVRLRKISVANNAPPPPTQVEFFIPIQAGVEHFFTRWFSMGIAAQSRFIEYIKDDRFEVTINTTTLLGQLFFYTD